MPKSKSKTRKAIIAPERFPESRGAPALIPVWNILLPGGSQLGEDRIRLLQAIDHTGSLLEAAALCGISYRTAWARVQELNTNFDSPLLESVQGGSEGGGTRLSHDAKRLLSLHQEATRLFRKAASEHGLEASDTRALDGFRQRLSMRTSVRNQYPGKVVSVTRGKVQADILLALPGGAKIVSQVTTGSCDALGLKPGAEAWALVKSSWVEIVAGEAPPRLPTRNILAGTVATIKRGTATDEIVLALEGGERVVGMIPPRTTAALSLGKGVEAWAVFDASSVILAVN